MPKTKPGFTANTIEVPEERWAVFKALAALRGKSTLQLINEVIADEIQEAADTGELVVGKITSNAKGSRRRK